MTYDNTSCNTSVGACPFSKGRLDDSTREQPRDINKLNIHPHCKESLGVAVLSYKYECTKCLGYFKGWLLYFVLVMLPIIIFFLIVIFCNIRAAAAHNYECSHLHKPINLIWLGFFSCLHYRF